MAKTPLIVLTGPTAVGKTNLSIKLAKTLGGEIISADSMQVYKHMDIGSAKITQVEMAGVTHHMIDILEPFDEFNVVIFKEKVKQCIEEIVARNHIPILTGGTGFYIQAVLYDIDFTENEENSEIRTGGRKRSRISSRPPYRGRQRIRGKHSCQQYQESDSCIGIL